MDSNSLRFWMLAEAAHWKQGAGVEYDSSRKVLRLARHRSVPASATSEAQARILLNRVPASIDRFGTRAFLSASGTVDATGAAPESVTIFEPPPGDTITDIAIGYDDALYVAAGGHIVIVDLRGRWDPVTVPDQPGFSAWRLAAAIDGSAGVGRGAGGSKGAGVAAGIGISAGAGIGVSGSANIGIGGGLGTSAAGAGARGGAITGISGGAWVLDPDNHKLGRVRGLPSGVRPHPPYSPNTVRPCEENPHPPRLTVETGAVWPADERAVAIATSPEGRLALLTWTATGLARVRVLGPEGTFGPPKDLGVQWPYSLTWASADLVAVLLPGMGEALAYEPDEPGSSILPAGDVYPLRDHDGGPFLHGTTLPPQFPTASGSAGLYKLSLPSYARRGEASNAIVLDSGSVSTVWHRLYLEAAIPEHCGVTVQIAAVNDANSAVPLKEEDAAGGSSPPTAVVTKETDPVCWYPHEFGQIFSPRPDRPRGAWVPSASEVPLHPGVLACPREKDRAGLFTALIQRSGLRTRALRGRFLKVRLELLGDGRSTPEVAGVRAYASRFSYVDRYLPELYREDLFGPDADATGRSTPADFLERFLDNFEGILTPLEDKIASSYLYTDAGTAPEEAIEWLGSWIGVTFDSAYTTSQRRRMLRAAPDLFSRRGTLYGLARALDIATDGAVERGQIVILENYRLRRTFATILGANLADENDPLLGGIASSGNSFVGDTLFLGDEHRKEFLALFGDDLPKTRSERHAVEAFYDGLAYRITVLVHQEIEPQDLGLVRRVVRLETPAHVSVHVAKATARFRAGVASLIGVDTYLAPRPRLKPVRVDVSYLGGGDLVERPPSLDPRLEGGG